MSTEESNEEAKENAMRKLRIDKVTVNIGVGKSGEPLEKAKQVLMQIAAQKPCPRRARRTIKDWGVRMGEPIGCMVSLRREKARGFLKRALEAVGNKLRESSFDDLGNISFGIKEHIEIPGTKYIPELGIFGMDVNVTLERPGYRVKRRVLRRSKVGKRHLITRDEARKFMVENFGAQIFGG
jgi:large subunit ribosomal protein L5